ncbi:hypothetical protein [Schlesneria paludicola]|uniref:hypothetical protein n=1 Tax=Schlesneria paludicola TaxID=360056 RepID=UPI001ED97159|nr:hypothetical protein [Schlesneria paludicola]
MLLLLVLILDCGQLVYGQGIATSGTSSTVHEANSKSKFRLNVVWNSRFGNFTYVPEKWADLHLAVQNSVDASRELLCATYFDDDPTLQFGRDVWLPARSKLRITHPVLIPKYSESKGRAINLHSLVIEKSSGEEILVKSESGQLLHETSMLVTHSRRNTAVIAGSRASEWVPSDVMNLIVACRVDQRLNNKVTILGDQFLPSDEAGLSRLDHIVIAEDRLADDFAAMSALRDWVSAGGHLWVMVDRVKPLFLERLFGDDFTSGIIDRVGLTTVRMDRPAMLIDPVEIEGETVEHEEPVELVRMIPSNMEVSYTVNGWPAAMSRSYGEGRIMLTTLGASGWMKPRKSDPEKKDSAKAVDPMMISDFVAGPEMMNLSSEFFRIPAAELLSPSDLEPQVREYIGYHIPSFSLIVGLLTCFLVSQVALGVWLMRTERLEHLGWIGTSFAVAISLVLLLIGISYRHGVPGTIASIQMAQAIPGTDEVRSQGCIAVYHPEGSASEIQTTCGGLMFPDMSGLENATRRMVTTDLGAWRWENLVQSAGLRVYSFARAETVVARIEAVATLDANGISGRYSGRLPPGDDSVLATRFGRLGVTLKGDGTFAARADSAFEASQYLSARLLSDEQIRRRRTLETLFKSHKEKGFALRPQLLFWSEKWEHGFHFGDDLKPQGSTLISVPLVIQRPANGTEILIPPALLAYRNRINPDGSKGSSIWDEFREKWLERSTPGVTWLSFQVPRELLPIVARRARLSIMVTGPVGRIEILGLRRHDVVSLHTVVDPVGTVQIELDDISALSISDDGQLSLGLQMGDSSRPGLTMTVAGTATQSGAEAQASSAVTNVNAGTKVNYWKIESLTLQLWAKTTEPIAND